MIAWRDKFIAFTVHFFLTLLVAAAAAVLIFRIWFPDPFQEMSGGTRLFLLIVACDVALGPLISLVIYDRRKSRRQLVIDYSVVAIIQLAAVIYGVYAISKWRPVYIVYAVDRLEVVGAAELDPADVKAATKPYDTLPAWGPELVAVRPPEDPGERAKAFSQALAGKDLPLVPRYYEPYEAQLPQIKKYGKRIAELESGHPGAREAIEAAIKSTGSSREQLLWLPVKARGIFWTALIDAGSGTPQAYVHLDPY